MLDSALPAPRLLTVFPPGGKAGTAVEVAFTGADLEELDRMLFSHPGIKAEPVLPPARQGRAPRAAAQATAAKPPVTKFKVTIGRRGSRRASMTSALPASGASAIPAPSLSATLPRCWKKSPMTMSSKLSALKLNSTINGTLVNPTDVDYYVFAGKKGQRVVFSCLASTIDSRVHPEIAGLRQQGQTPRQQPRLPRHRRRHRC